MFAYLCLSCCIKGMHWCTIGAAVQCMVCSIVSCGWQLFLPGSGLWRQYRLHPCTHQAVCLCREDEAWLDIKLHCTSQGTAPKRVDTAMALDQIPHLPGAASNSPAEQGPQEGKLGAPEAKSHPDAVRLSDVSYDSKTTLCGRSSASAFFLQPGYASADCGSRE